MDAEASNPTTDRRPVEPMTPDERFWRAIWPEGRLRSLCVSDAGGGRFRPLGMFDTPQALLASVPSGDVNVYLGAHFVRAGAQGRGRNEDVTGSVVVVADLDWSSPAHTASGLPSEADVRTVLADAPLPPSFVVNTGHGLHGWWVLDSEVGPERLSALTAGLHWYLSEQGLKPERNDLASVLRVPGTRNVKLDATGPVVRLDAQSTGDVYKPDDFAAAYPAPAARKATTAKAALTPASLGLYGESPIDWYIRTTDFLAELQGDGWTVEQDRGDEVYLKRPGKTGGGHSAVLHLDGKPCLVIFSTADEVDASLRSFEVTPGQYPRLDAFEYLTQMRFDGNRQRALEWVTRERGRSRSVTDGLKTCFILPDDFWDEPWLQAVRQSALSSWRSPTAVLFALLARRATIIHPSIVLPDWGGSHVSLNLYVALVGKPGQGKSTSADVAARLMPDVGYTNVVKWGAVLSTSAGLVDAFHQRVPAADGSNKKDYVFIPGLALNAYSDEAKALQVAGEQGERLNADLRAAFMGEGLGQLNATEELRRHAVKLQYRLTLIAGMQEPVADRLLLDLELGTPQRFLWASVSDPTVKRNAPPRPEPIEWPEVPYIVDMGKALRVVEFADGIYDEVGDALFLAATEGVPELEEHRVVLTMKVAAILALCEGSEPEVSHRHWTKAKQIVDLSMTYAAYMRADASLRTMRQQVERKQQQRRTERAAKARDQQELEAAARERILSVLRGLGPGAGLPPGKLRNAIRYEGREEVWPRGQDTCDVLDDLIEAGAVERYDGPKAAWYRIGNQA